MHKLSKIYAKFVPLISPKTKLFILWNVLESDDLPLLFSLQ